MKRYLHSSIFLICLVLMCNQHLSSQEMGAISEKETQPIIMLRYFEDYQFLADTTKHIDFLDPIKYISLSKKKPDWYLSIGGDVRFLYEYINNRFEGETNGDGYLLHRYMLHSDWHFGNKLRLFVQLGSTLENGRQAGPRPGIDQDELFLHQFFADYSFTPFEGVNSTLRLGRQEVVLGSGRLVTIREGPNTRLSFDGVRWMNRWKKWNVEALYIRPVVNKPGTFDNEIFDDQVSLWGLYANWKAEALSFINFDTFFLGYKNEQSIYHQGTGEEDRYTVGGRVFGNLNNFDFNLEGGYQFGTFKQSAGEGDISSYGVSLDVGRTFKDLPFSPRLSVKAEYIQGDNDRDDLDLNTTNAFFPNQGYFRGAAPLFPTNFYDIHPELRLNFSKTNYLVIDWTAYWRESVEDGIYLPSSVPINPLLNGDDRFLGSQIDIETYWQLNRNIYLLAIYSHLFQGDAFENNPSPAEIADFVNIALSYKF